MKKLGAYLSHSRTLAQIRIKAAINTILTAKKSPVSDQTLVEMKERGRK